MFSIIRPALFEPAERRIGFGAGARALNLQQARLEPQVSSCNLCSRKIHYNYYLAANHNGSSELQLSPSVEPGSGGADHG